MKVVFVTPYPSSRIRLRSYGFITHLARDHHVECFVLCANTRERADAQALQRLGVKVTAIYEPPGIRYLRGCAALSTSTPLQVAFDASPRLRDALQQRLHAGQIDLLHLEMVRTLGVLPQTLSIPVVWDAVDCISQLYELGAQAGATRMLRLIGHLEARRVRGYEREYIQRFPHILVTAERDRQALLQLPGSVNEDSNHRAAKISVVPLGVDQHYFQPYHGIREPDTLIFSGKMSFHANIAGVKLLVEQILPQLWQHRPHIKLVIAGSDPPPAIRRYAHDPRIEVTGYLPDLRSTMQRAMIAVCPLPYAVGTQSKVIEAMALGTPVIASQHASAGLQACAGQDFLLADTPEEVVRTVLRLLDDHQLWLQLSQRGVRYVANYHHWDHITQQLTSIYQQVLAAW